MLLYVKKKILKKDVLKEIKEIVICKEENTGLQHFLEIKMRVKIILYEKKTDALWVLLLNLE